jgi:hypothetical protein
MHRAVLRDAVPGDHHVLALTGFDPYFGALATVPALVPGPAFVQ